MSALNNFNLVGYCKEQKTFPIGDGLRNIMVVEVQTPAKTGMFPKDFEVNVLPGNNGNYKDKDVAISGIVSSYRSKTGFINIVLTATNIVVLGKAGSQVAGTKPQQQPKPQTQEEVEMIAADLPF